MRPAADLFSGGGGWSWGARKSGKLEVLFAGNHWEDAIDCHRANFPNARHVMQDLNLFDYRHLPDLSNGMLIASPACPGFSSCGRPGRVVRGAAEKHRADRETMWCVTQAVELARPQSLVVENVTEAADWDLFDIWLSTFRRLGYRVDTTRVNVRDAGVAQDRQRIVVVGEREADPRSFTLTGKQGSLGDCIEDDPQGVKWELIANKKRMSKKGMLGDRIRAAQKGRTERLFWANVDSAVARTMDQVAPTMTTRSAGQWFILEQDMCRKLTVGEMARIQGWPNEAVLPTDRTKAGGILGNSVPPRFATQVLAQVG